MNGTSRLRRIAGLFAVAALAAGIAAAPAAAAGGTWTIEPSVIMQKPTGDLADISCVAGEQTRCLAVGSAISHFGNLTSTTQLWNGSSWQDTGSPHRMAHGTYWPGISCTAALTCMAVGDDSSSTHLLAAQWTPDSGWRQLPAPLPATAQGDPNWLYGVACSSASACFAVGGYYQAADGNAGALVETWNGSRWTVARIPSIAHSSLSGVSCASAASCVAVGSGDGHLLALRWDGTAWTAETMPDPPGSGTLHAVSCATAQSCMAVGERYDDDTGKIYSLAERWDGTSWSITDTQDVPDVIENQLFDLSCATADYCVAVGSVTPYNQQHTLVETWDGTAWQLARSPNGGTGMFTQFDGVSCVSTRDCLAVGSATARGTDPPGGQSFSARSNGTRWTALSGGSTTGAVAGRFNGLSCASAEDCVAVGNTYAADAHSRTLAQVRTAAGWRVTPTPQGVGVANTLLAGVSCPAVKACMAVGRTSNLRFGGGRSDGPFAVWWNGTSWARLDPIDAPKGNGFIGVSCVTRQWCVAVGDDWDKPLLETWDGTTWTKVDIAAPSGALDSRLTGISCATARSCVAVGDYDTSVSTTIHTYAVVEKNGSWRTVDTGGLTGYAPGVSCTSATLCTAVGAASSAQIWNGSSWSTVPMPAPARAVSCVTPTSCVAATGQGVESWNGTKWRIDPDVEPSGSGSASFYAVSCLSVSRCTAAGVRGSIAQEEPLIESTSG